MPTNPHDLKIFKMAYDFVIEIYKIIYYLPEHEKNNIADQLKRAATSLPLNIAEGCGAKTQKQFHSYCYYAYNSGKEIEVLLMLSRDLKYLSPEITGRLMAKLDVFMRFLYTFITKIEEKLERKNKISNKYKKFKMDNEIIPEQFIENQS